MRRRMIRLMACCLTVGLLTAGQAVLSADASENEVVVQEKETEAPKAETETETEQKTTKKKKKKKKQTESTTETSSVDLSMKGQMIFAKCEEHINIRKGPGTDSEVVGKLYNNCMATVLSKDGDWFEIQSGNAVGFVKAEYFATGEEAEAIAEEIGYHVATVYADELNIRALPNDEAEVIAVGYKGEEYEALSYEDDWIMVYLGDDVCGYMNAYYAGYDTYYPEGETLEEEQARLEAEAAEEEYYAEETLPEDTYYYEPTSDTQSSTVTTQPQTQAQTQAQTQPQTQAQTQAQTQPQTQAQTQPQTQAQTQPQTEAQTQAQTQPQTEAQAQTSDPDDDDDEYMGDVSDDMYYDAATGEMKKFED